MSRGGKPGWAWGSGPSDAWKCTFSGSVTLRSPEPGTWGGGLQFGLLKSSGRKVIPYWFEVRSFLKPGKCH